MSELIPDVYRDLLDSCYGGFASARRRFEETRIICKPDPTKMVARG